MLRTRSPRAHPLYCYRELRVRLACVKHAASVRSEPGSNSRLKPDVSTVAATLRSERTVKSLGFSLTLNKFKARLLNRLLIRYTRTKRPKPNGFWHVSSDCQRAGTPRPAGSTTGKRQYYRSARNESSDLKEKLNAPREENGNS